MVRLLATPLALIATMLLASPALAERDFRIANTPFAQAEVLDARGTASLAGEPAVLITLADTAHAKLQRLTAALIGQALPVSLDGRALTAPVLREAVADGMVELTGFASFEESEAVAELISGKPPLPDSLDE
ncbi:MAG: hypothetical protein RJB22_1643 [Pseudomonadota bacterium]|jgi:preprotein translocase subunit SecD